MSRHLSESKGVGPHTSVAELNIECRPCSIAERSPYSVVVVESNRVADRKQFRLLAHVDEVFLVGEFGRMHSDDESPRSRYLSAQARRYGSALKLLMQECVQKFTRTTLPYRSSGRSGRSNWRAEQERPIAHVSKRTSDQHLSTDPMPKYRRHHRTIDSRRPTDR